MELIELLDQIDETAPHCCQTCKHAATHARCDGCLGQPGQPADDPFPYHNWEPGNWMREQHAAEVAGHKAIVIGGQGEMDFIATNSPEAVSKHLHYVAEEVGCFCGSLAKRGDRQRMHVITDRGSFRIEWTGGELQRVVEWKGAEAIHVGWDRNNPGATWR